MNIDIETIKPLYTRVAMVLLGGFKWRRAAAILGVHENTIGRLWKNPEFREYYRKLEGERNEHAVENTSRVEGLFQQYSETAARHLIDMMENTEDEGKRKALCDDILDRAGFAPRQRLDVNQGKPMRIVIEDTTGSEAPAAGDLNDTELEALSLSEDDSEDPVFEEDLKKLLEAEERLDEELNGPPLPE